MQKIRASYGTFGIVFEVNVSRSTDDTHGGPPPDVRSRRFHRAAPRAEELDSSMMYFMFHSPTRLRSSSVKYNPGAVGQPNRALWQLRNYVWASGAPKFARYTEQFRSVKSIRYGMIRCLLCRHAPDDGESVAQRKQLRGQTRPSVIRSPPTTVAIPLACSHSP